MIPPLKISLHKSQTRLEEKSRELSYEYFLIYDRLSNDKDRIPNTFAVEVLYYTNKKQQKRMTSVSKTSLV